MGFGSGGGSKFGSGRSDVGTDLTVDGSVKIKEGSAADADIAGQGQLWVKSDSPNNLYFTDDAGNDVQITNGGSLASGGGGTLAGLGSTDNAILRANGTGGETAQGSNVTLDDSNNFTIPTTGKVQFRDTGLFINSSTNGQLDIDADTELELTAPTLDIAASTEVTIASPAVTVTNSAAGKPVLTLKTTHTTKTSSGELQFLKDAADTEDGEVLGKITFFGEDEGNNNTQFAGIVASISESDDSDEAGTLELQVAESDGTTTAMTTGLKLEGEHATDGQIDVTIAAGAASTTTIAGTLTMGSTAAMTNAGLLSVGNQSNITGTGALDSGSITSGFGNIDIGSSSLAAGSLDVSDGDITNVGDIALDSISADGNDINVAVSDNRGTAFTIKQGSDAYLIVDTGDGSESVSIGTGISGTAITIGHSTSETTVADNLTVTGTATISSGDVDFGNGQNAVVAIAATAHDTAGKNMTLTAGPTTAGTTNNIAGGSLTLQGGQGKGSGAGGDIIFQTANAGGSGSSLNSHATALTISDDLSATFEGVVKLKDDKTLTFGTNDDATFEYDEDGTDRLLYAGAGLRISDDVKLEFGTGGDATIEYDEDGNDVLSISGAATKFTVTGVEIENASDSGAAALLIDNDDVDKIALDIDGANTTANIVDITAGALTSGKALNLTATGGTCKEAVKLTHSYSDTTAVTSVPGICPLHIDFDKTGDSSGADKMTGLFIDMDNTTADGGNILMRGLLVTPTLQLDSNSDDPVVIGGDFEVTGHTNGNDSVARGLDITVSGADFNQGIHIKSAVGGSGTSPSGNHLKLISGGSDTDTFQISVMANGETLLKSVDSGSSGSDADAHIHILADGNLTLDAEADIIFDAKGNDFNFKADGTEVLRISNSSSDVVIKPTVSQKDIIFQNSDNEECARIVDASADGGDTAVISNTIGLAPGFGFNKPSLLISAASGDTAVTLTQEISGYLILLSPENNSITVTLPAITSDALIGIHYEFILIAPLASGKTVTIKTAGAGSDNNDNFFLHHVTTAGSRTFDGDGDTLTIPATTVAGAIIECTALTSDYDPSTAATLEEVWLAKSIANTVITCTDT